MKKNMGTLDKVIRILIAISIIALYYSGIVSGTLAIILLLFSVVFIATSFISFCPLYIPFKINTTKR
ncbi:MAG: DUF2892 domain-containing protein [Bacteroidetes bacterium]|nr:DUF2892 domain-containing protein [Bacteroidota bacterium]MBU1372281.1 DUF2892 domain-containing protein [Bacteroidota bacterium]MBU1486044.1 DUF2892 domain-containing protein [Bacteroidota bacterium]MBU1761993.1 DUF2892 domain-containing protein [Bacteroidota bacterium]MBU2045571.1 DUF2892 domain-containing protein [Bacteroidota bacterium]